MQLGRRCNPIAGDRNRFRDALRDPTRGVLPDIPGVRGLESVADLVAIATWLFSSRLVIARRQRGRARVAALLVLVGAPVTWPLAIALYAGRARRGCVRYYLRDRAVLAVELHEERWVLCDHVAARPGGGEAAGLRRAVIPAIITAADVAGVRLELVVHSSRLGAKWLQEIPGLRDSGSTALGGRRYRYEPRARADGTRA